MKLSDSARASYADFAKKCRDILQKYNLEYVQPEKNTLYFHTITSRRISFAHRQLLAAIYIADELTQDSLAKYYLPKSIFDPLSFKAEQEHLQNLLALIDAQNGTWVPAFKDDVNPTDSLLSNNSKITYDLTVELHQLLNNLLSPINNLNEVSSTSKEKDQHFKETFFDVSSLGSIEKKAINLGMNQYSPIKVLNDLKLSIEASMKFYDLLKNSENTEAYSKAAKDMQTFFEAQLKLIEDPEFERNYKEDAQAFLDSFDVCSVSSQDNKDSNKPGILYNKISAVSNTAFWRCLNEFWDELIGLNEEQIEAKLNLFAATSGGSQGKLDEILFSSNLAGSNLLNTFILGYERRINEKLVANNKPLNTFFLSKLEKKFNINSCKDLINKFEAALNHFQTAAKNYNGDAKKKKILTGLSTVLPKNFKAYYYLPESLKTIFNDQFYLIKKLGDVVYQPTAEEISNKESIFNEYLEKIRPYLTENDLQKIDGIEFKRFEKYSSGHFNAVTRIIEDAVSLPNLIFKTFLSTQHSINEHNQHCYVTGQGPGSTGTIFNDLKIALMNLLSEVNYTNDPFFLLKLSEHKNRLRTLAGLSPTDEITVDDIINEFEVVPSMQQEQSKSISPLVTLLSEQLQSAESNLTSLKDDDKVKTILHYGKQIATKIQHQLQSIPANLAEFALTYDQANDLLKLIQNKLKNLRPHDAPGAGHTMSLSVSKETVKYIELNNFAKNLAETLYKIKDYYQSLPFSEQIILAEPNTEENMAPAFIIPNIIELFEDSLVELKDSIEHSKQSSSQVIEEQMEVQRLLVLRNFIETNEGIPFHLLSELNIQFLQEKLGISVTDWQRYQQLQTDLQSSWSGMFLSYLYVSQDQHALNEFKKSIIKGIDVLLVEANKHLPKQETFLRTAERTIIQANNKVTEIYVTKLTAILDEALIGAPCGQDYLLSLYTEIKASLNDDNKIMGIFEKIVDDNFYTESSRKISPEQKVTLQTLKSLLANIPTEYKQSALTAALDRIVILSPILHNNLSSPEWFETLARSTLGLGNNQLLPPDFKSSLDAYTEACQSVLKNDNSSQTEVAATLAEAYFKLTNELNIIRSKEVRSEPIRKLIEPVLLEYYQKKGVVAFLQLYQEGMQDFLIKQLPTMEAEILKDSLNKPNFLGNIVRSVLNQEFSKIAPEASTQSAALEDIKKAKKSSIVAKQAPNNIHYNQNELNAINETALAYFNRDYSDDPEPTQALRDFNRDFKLEQVDTAEKDDKTISQLIHNFFKDDIIAAAVCARGGQALTSIATDELNKKFLYNHLPVEISSVSSKGIYTQKAGQFFFNVTNALYEIKAGESFFIANKNGDGLEQITSDELIMLKSEAKNKGLDSPIDRKPILTNTCTIKVSNVDGLVNFSVVDFKIDFEVPNYGFQLRGKKTASYYDKIKRTIGKIKGELDIHKEKPKDAQYTRDFRRLETDENQNSRENLQIETIALKNQLSKIIPINVDKAIEAFSTLKYEDLKLEKDSLISSKRLINFELSNFKAERNKILTDIISKTSAASFEDLHEKLLDSYPMIGSSLKPEAQLVSIAVAFHELAEKNSNNLADIKKEKFNHVFESAKNIISSLDEQIKKHKPGKISSIKKKLGVKPEGYQLYKDMKEYRESLNHILMKLEDYYKFLNSSDPFDCTQYSPTMAKHIQSNRAFEEIDTKVQFFQAEIKVANQKINALNSLMSEVRELDPNAERYGAVKKIR